MIAAKIAANDDVPGSIDHAQTAAMEQLLMLHEVATAAGGFAASPTAPTAEIIALRFALAGSLAQATVLDIAGSTERVATVGLRALVADRAASPSTNAAAKLLAEAIAAAFIRIDAVLPDLPQIRAA